MNGINYVTNEKTEIKAILLDLVQMKQDKTVAADVLKQLSDLQDLINNAPEPAKQNAKTWDAAKQALEKFKE
jgi:hypothetical protein